MTLPEKHFDMLDYVKKSKEFGVQEELAEYQARQFADVIDFASASAKNEFNFHELATRADVKKIDLDIKQLKNDIGKVQADIKELTLATKNDIGKVQADIKELTLATKNDIGKVQADIKELALTTRADIEQLRLTTKTDIKQLEVEIARSRYDSLKFTVWTGVSSTMFLLCTLGGLMVKSFHMM